MNIYEIGKNRIEELNGLELLKILIKRHIEWDLSKIMYIKLIELIIWLNLVDLIV